MHRLYCTLLAVLCVIPIVRAQPRIFSGPEVDSLAPDAMKVRWSTLFTGSSKLLYGRGESLTDSVESQALTKDHSLVVTGLESGVIYALKALSTNATGTSESSVQYGVTPTPASTGTIQVYFNFSVDATLPIGGQAEGSVDLGQKLLERISAASHSIDLALYSFSDYTGSAPDIARVVADSLVAAKNRGVSVRMVYDDRSTTSPVNTLLSAGIPVVKRNVSGGIMHNKFWIFDARDSTSATDDWVVIGSWNMTDGGTYLEAQNAVFFQDRSLALIYMKEFEEMFGSSTDAPDLAAARFGPAKSNNTPHWTYVGNTRVDVYFSPSDGTNSFINSALSRADENIFFSLLVFTRDDLASMIQSRASAGVVVKGLINDISVQGSEYQVLRDAGLDVLQAQKQGATAYVLHHKYGVVDPFNDGSDPMVITGSHNWSTAADVDNDENTVIVHSGPLARTFVREFSHRYAESGGTGVIVGVGPHTGPVPDGFSLSEAWPNPFNPSTNLRVSLPAGSEMRLSAVDLLGREVDVIANGLFGRGDHSFSWEPRVSGGIYFIVLRVAGHMEARKVIYLR